MDEKNTPVLQDVDTVQAVEQTAENTIKTETQHPVTRRYNKRGKRRGKYAYAAPLGMLITLLAIAGVVGLVFTGISAVQKATDTTALKEELYYFLEPLLTYNPTPFEDITVTEQDAFLKAAAYRVALAEQNRMLYEGDENCRYAVDDQGRIAVPVEEIEASYNALFGSASPLTHRTLEEESLVFSAADNCYYVPFQSLATGYTPVVESVKRRSGAYMVRVGFVANKDIQINEHGKEIPPTADMATYYQTYTLLKHADGYYVNACADE